MGNHTNWIGQERIKTRKGLIKWPQRLGAFTPATRIEMRKNLTATGAEGQGVRVTALGGGWAKEIVEQLDAEGLVV